MDSVSGEGISCPRSKSWSKEQKCFVETDRWLIDSVGEWFWVKEGNKMEKRH